MSRPSARALLRGLFLWVGMGLVGQNINPELPLNRLGIVNWDATRGLPGSSVGVVFRARDRHLWATTIASGLLRLDGSRVEVFNSASVPLLTSPGFFSITESSDGTLYFGAIDGWVYAYEKGAFRRLPEVPSHHGKGVLVFHSRRGHLLAFSFGGGELSRWAEGRWVPHFPPGNPLQGHEITTLWEDAQNQLWIGTRANGLWRDSLERGLVPVPDWKGQQILEITGIAQDLEGHLWVSSYRQGLWRTEGPPVPVPSLRPFLMLKEPVPKPPRAALGAPGGVPQGRRDEHSGSTRFERDAGERRPPPQPGGTTPGGRPAASAPLNDEPHRPAGPSLQSIPPGVVAAHGGFGTGSMASPRVVALTPGLHGEMWMGSGGGLFRYYKGTLDRLAAGDAGFKASVIHSITHDREGNLWLGAGHVGMIQLVPRPFQTFGPREGSPSPEVNAIAEDAQGRFWIGGQTGLSGLDANDRPLPTFDHAPFGNERIIKDLLVDRRGTLWLGTRLGLYRLEGNRFIRVPLGQPNPFPYARTLLEDREGALWIGTSDGLCRLKGGSTRWWDERGGLSNGYVLSLAEGPRGRIWVGTRGGGITVFDQEKPSRLGTDSGLPSDVVFRMLVDSQGTLWIGTQKGLARFKDDRFTHVGKTGGLASLAVYQVLEDDFGFLWLGTSSGPVKVSKAALEAFWDGKASTIPFHPFDEADGLRKPIVNALSHSLKDSRGRLWFATPDGAARIDPRQSHPAYQPPPLTLLKIVQGSRTLPALAPRLDLPDGAPLEIHYTALAFRAPQRVRFRYQMEGVDAVPVEADSRRIAYYSSLPPGAHRFRVWAFSDLEGWTTPPQELMVVRPPVWHETWAFRGLVMAILVGSPFAWFRWRLVRIRKRNQALRNQVREATAALETANRELEDRVRDRTRELQAAYEQAKAADEAKTNFLSRMSHELRTPVNHMLLVSQLIREEWPDQETPVPTRDFEAVQKAGQELGALISALLDFSSLEAGRLNLELAPFNTAHCLANFESLYQSLARQKGLGFEMALGTGLPEWLLGDSQRLCQVTKELLSNAVKFTDHGKVALKANWDAAASTLRMEVTDTGPGISEAGRKLIFRPFEQADGTLTRRHGGSGLGLAIAKRIVDLMGGRIGFESNPGKGSRFWVEVPLAEVPIGDLNE